ncbi:uncharacterized protein LOC109719117 [Ananas comosus]|uniref:Uncharacterized protein LOC109719117 n=2 Tax=Ananas comosus TaxID=4615 RepID=A0A6P5G7K7_ANACO|nr:uncharacterized protein LOC109719117 [Ananas comosus]
MEKEERDGANNTTAILAVATTDVTNKACSLRPPAGKKRGTLSLIRAALFMVRGCSSGKKKFMNAEAPGSPSAAEAGWKTLVSGMRPLHVPQLEYYPSNPLLLPPPPPVGHESYHDVSLPPASPAHSTSSGEMSRYASAEDLQALDKNDDDLNSDEATDDGSGGPNAIDVQAEDFIAKFYEQMRLQRMESFNHNTM